MPTLEDILAEKKGSVRNLDSILNEKRQPNIGQQDFLLKKHQKNLEQTALADEQSGAVDPMTGVSPARGLPGVNKLPPSNIGTNAGAFATGATESLIPGDYSGGMMSGLKKSLWSNPENPGAESDLMSGAGFIRQHPLSAANLLVDEPGRQMEMRADELKNSDQIGPIEHTARKVASAIPFAGPFMEDVATNKIPKLSYGTPQEKANAAGGIIAPVVAPKLMSEASGKFKMFRNEGGMSRLQKGEDQLNVAMGNRIPREQMKETLPHMDKYFREKGQDLRNMDLDQVRDFGKQALDEYWSKDVAPIQDHLKNINVDFTPAYNKALNSIDSVTKASIQSTKHAPVYIRELNALLKKSGSLEDLLEIRKDLNNSLDNFYDKSTIAREKFLKTNPRARAYNEALNGVRELIDTHIDNNAALPGQTKGVLKTFSNMKDFVDNAERAAVDNDAMKVAKNAKRFGKTEVAAQTASAATGMTGKSRALGENISALRSKANMPDALVQSAGKQIEGPGILNPKRIFSARGREAMGVPIEPEWDFSQMNPGQPGWTPPLTPPGVQPPSPAGPSYNPTGQPRNVNPPPIPNQLGALTASQTKLLNAAPSSPKSIVGATSPKELTSGQYEMEPKVVPNQPLSASPIDLVIGDEAARGKLFDERLSTKPRSVKPPKDILKISDKRSIKSREGDLEHPTGASDREAATFKLEDKRTQFTSPKVNPLAPNRMQEQPIIREQHVRPPDYKSKLAPEIVEQSRSEATQKGAELHENRIKLGKVKPPNAEFVKDYSAKKVGDSFIVKDPANKTVAKARTQEEADSIIKRMKNREDLQYREGGVFGSDEYKKFIADYLKKPFRSGVTSREEVAPGVFEAGEMGGHKMYDTVIYNAHDKTFQDTTMAGPDPGQTFADKVLHTRKKFGWPESQQ